MIPSEIETYCRNVTNKIGDTFYTADEIHSYLDEVQKEVSIRAKCLQDRTTMTAATGTYIYDLPSQTIRNGIYAIEYAGVKLGRMDYNQYTILEGNDKSSLTEADPLYYMLWGDQFYLYPKPISNDEMVLYRYKRAATITTASTLLSVNADYHYKMCDYIIAQMYLKDKDDRGVAYLNKWVGQSLPDIIREEQKSKRYGGFAQVKDVENMSQGEFGDL